MHFYQTTLISPYHHFRGKQGRLSPGSGTSGCQNKVRTNRERCRLQHCSRLAEPISPSFIHLGMFLCASFIQIQQLLSPSFIQTMSINYRRSPKLQLFDTGMVNYFSGIQDYPKNLQEGIAQIESSILIILFPRYRTSPPSQFFPEAVRLKPQNQARIAAGEVRYQSSKVLAS